VTNARLILSRVPIILVTLLGLGAFIYPMVISPQSAGGSSATAHAGDAPLIFILLITLCLLIVLADLEGQSLDSKTIALLGILSAINAVLRFIPGPVGFGAVYFLPILCGYVYGGDFGFLLGTLSLFVSALITGGVGPWLPYQMFALGWTGLSAGWLPNLRRWPRAEIALLALFGAVWGLIFGAVMNLWFWPYIASPTEGGGLPVLHRYATFYFTTSFWWDLGRAGGNAVLILLFGAPLLRLLRRFQQRFHFVSDRVGYHA
jgi:energy-coupling factor transport system substrate-specific component